MFSRDIERGSDIKWVEFSILKLEYFMADISIYLVIQYGFLKRNISWYLSKFWSNITDSSWKFFCFSPLKTIVFII